MINSYNKKEAEKARKRRAMFYRLYLKNDDIYALAKKFKMTYERMRQHIRKAEGDLR